MFNYTGLYIYNIYSGKTIWYLHMLCLHIHDMHTFASGCISLFFILFYLGRTKMYERYACMLAEINILFLFIYQSQNQIV